MNDLIAFVEARLAEDEAIALAIPYRDWREDSSWLVDMISPLPSQLRERPGWVPMITREDIRHIARHDPARVLREVEARRRTLAWHLRVKDPNAPAYDLPDQCGPCYQEWPCHDLRNLAAVWSDHPDYRAEWRPE